MQRALVIKKNSTIFHDNVRIPFQKFTEFDIEIRPHPRYSPARQQIP